MISISTNARTDMTQEYKELLLKDLCARLPYGVKVQNVLDDSLIIDLKKYLYCLPAALVPNFKPFLRPMSSMTEKEMEEFREVIEIELKALEEESGHNVANAAPAAFEIDFYNAHHFDYRGLIEKGLALEAPVGMYN